ncbi:MAG: tetratricopeptide repeat protein [Balneolaceae bacterium]
MRDSSQKIRTLALNVKNNPGDIFSKFALALELLKNNQVQKALVLFESIYKHHPDYLGVYYHLGKLYQSMEEPQRSAQIFSEGIEIAKKRNDTRTLLELTEALEVVKEEQ